MYHSNWWEKSLYAFLDQKLYRLRHAMWDITYMPIGNHRHNRISRSHKTCIHCQLLLYYMQMIHQPTQPTGDNIFHSSLNLRVVPPSPPSLRLFRPHLRHRALTTLNKWWHSGTLEHWHTPQRHRGRTAVVAPGEHNPRQVTAATG